MAIKTEEIKRGDLHGYLAQPDGGARSGVLILPTIFAVNQFARGFADGLANAGLAAAVWDPYSGLPLVTEYEESRKRSRALTDAGVGTVLSKWLKFMLDDLRLNSLGTVGFCLGGRFALLLAAAVPAFALQLTPGSVQGIPRHPQAVRGFDILTKAVGPGVVSPAQILVDAGPGGNVLAPQTQAAIGRLIRRTHDDSEVAAVFYAPGGRFVDAGRRYAQVIVAGKHEYGDEESQLLTKQLRNDIVPSAHWPSGVDVRVGGGPPQGVDFLHRSYTVFPWLVIGVLVLTYLLLLRAFRSLILPLKAVILNLLSVAAAYGMLVITFRWGAGKDLIGLYQFSQIEGWIPIFLFAMLFGLSMDYEVFLVTRMRELWDERHDNTRAVAEGLERTGRIVTAAAIIMVAAFSGFVAGRILGLQEFGLGLAVAIFVDATIVRALLVPALMAVFGRWNWWLPARVARAFRVKPSPLEAPEVAVRPAGR